MAAAKSLWVQTLAGQKNMNEAFAGRTNNTTTFRTFQLYERVTFAASVSDPFLGRLARLHPASGRAEEE